MCLDKQWKIERKNGEIIYLRDILSRTVKWINKFKEVGDTLVQYDPGHAAIPWAAVRFVLQTAINENEIHGAMLEGVERISSLIARYTTVETLYLQSKSMERERLKNAVINLYVAILQFLLSARRFFSRSTGRRIMGSLVQSSDMKVNTYLNAIAEAENRVIVLARLVDAEYIQRTEKLLEGGFTNVNVKLDILSQNVDSLRTDLSHQLSLSEADRSMAITWLSAISTIDNYERAVSARLMGTCDWIQERREYQTWESQNEVSNHAKILWIHGPASFGKTIISASIVQRLESKFCSATKTLRKPVGKKDGRILDLQDTRTSTGLGSTASVPIVAYFFCSFEDEATRQPLAIMRSWISQIISRNDEALEMVLAFSREKRSTKATESDLWTLLERLSAQQEALYLVVDGFDECVSKTHTSKTHAISDDRTSFIHRLARSSARSNNKILLVSRANTDLRLSFLEAKEIIDFTEYEITLSDTSHDIQLFSHSVTEKRLMNKPDALRRELAAEAAQRCEGMFLWIRLLHDRFSPGRNAAQLREIVRNTPAGLEQAYDKELERIQDLDPEDRNHAVAVLRWTLFAVRPLTVRELTEALQISLKGEPGDFPEDSLPDVWDDLYLDHQIKKPCGSLIDIRIGLPDEPVHARSVSFVHFSVKEYLSNVFDTRFPRLENTLFSHVTEANDLLARCCLRYLFYDQFQVVSENDERLASSVVSQYGRYGFLPYAASSWPAHASKVNVPTDQLHHFIDELFDPERLRWRLWAQVYESGNRHRIGDTTVGFSSILRSPRNATPLYYAALLGLTEVMDSIYRKIQGREDVTAQTLRSDAFSQAARAAALGGHEDAVLYLLSHSARSPFQIEIPTLVVLRQGLPAFFASSVRSLGDLLFGPRRRGVCITKEELDELIVTASFGEKAKESENVIRLCLKFGASLESHDNVGITALHGAGRRGATNLIKYLLDEGLDVNTVSASGLSPLHFASQNGHDKAAKLLLDKGAQTNIRAHGRGGSTPLHLAAAAGHRDVVQLLINARADLEARVRVTETGSWTALCVAATLGQTSVVETLLLHRAKLELGDLIDCLISSSGFQPDSLNRLLDQYRADINLKSNGYTALHRAVRKGQITSVERLLDCGADRDVSDDIHGMTALQYAVMCRAVAIVRLLLKQGATIGRQDKHGRTALHYAVIVTHSDKADLVRLLVKEGSRVEAQDEDGNTVLHYAARSSMPASFHMLFRLGGPLNSVETANRKRQRPLHLAFDNILVTQSILASGAIVDPVDDSGATPFWYAAERGVTSVMRCLMDAGANIDVKGPTGQTALDRACSKIQAYVHGSCGNFQDARNNYQRWRATVDLLNQEEVADS